MLLLSLFLKEEQFICVLTIFFLLHRNTYIHILKEIFYIILYWDFELYMYICAQYLHSFVFYRLTPIQFWSVCSLSLSPSIIFFFISRLFFYFSFVRHVLHNCTKFLVKYYENLYIFFFVSVSFLFSFLLRLFLFPYFLFYNSVECGCSCYLVFYHFYK